MDAVSGWKEMFARWPADMPRRGVLVVAFGEQISFTNFATGDGFLLLERQSPDAVGGRTIVLAYDKILGLKLVDVAKAKALQALGFSLPGQR
jgi:hypothetical protein